MTLRARASRPTSVGVVGAGDALVEVARRDGVGRALHVLQRAQPEADQPPAAGQGQDQRAGGDGQLNEEQRMQGAGGVADGLGHHDEDLPTVARGLIDRLALVTCTRKAGPPLWSSQR